MEELKIPRHIAIIMDGNGRWAKNQGMPRVMGHYRGVEVAEDITEACIDLGVEYLTLFAFSTENWNRPREEVDTLFDLMKTYFHEKRERLRELGVRVRFLGRRGRLPTDLRKIMDTLERETQSCENIQVNIAIDYGGRDDIIRAVKKAISLGMEDIDEPSFSSLLDMSGVPDPDLLIRTAGERRISNFVLWNLAYTELYFTEVCWPEFTREELIKAIEDYSSRQRKFGRILDE